MSAEEMARIAKMAEEENWASPSPVSTHSALDLPAEYDAGRWNPRGSEQTIVPYDREAMSAGPSGYAYHDPFMAGPSEGSSATAHADGERYADAEETRTRKKDKGKGKGRESRNPPDTTTASSQTSLARRFFGMDPRKR
jgi:hypothetical protein